MIQNHASFELSNLNHLGNSVVITSNTSSSNSLASGGESYQSLTTMTQNGSAPWRAKISSTIKNSFLGTPRFHRRKFSAENEAISSGSTTSIGGSVVSSGGNESESEETLMLDTNELIFNNKIKNYYLI